MKLKHLQYLAAAGTLLAANQAFALGTDAGTAVNNTATVNYSIGGVAQGLIESSPNGNANSGAGNGQATTFLVDRELDVSVLFQDAGQTVNVTPGQTGTVLTFLVTNEGNATQDFLLDAIHRATGTVGEGTGKDNFDSTAEQVFVETNGVAGYQAGADTAVFIDELAEGASRIVYVISNIPLAQVNNDASKISVVAQVAVGGTAGAQGLAITNDTNGRTSPAGTYSNGGTTVAAGTAVNAADDPNVVQNVFRDDAGDVNSQGAAGVAGNGQHADTETLYVQTATLTVRKTSVVISDPVNGATNPKAIPGAVIEYCVIVANSGTSPANSVSITDPIPANTSYLAGSLRNAVTVTGGTAGQVTGTCDSATGTTQTDAVGDDDGSAVGTGAPGAGTVTLSYPTVGTASTVASKFRVTLQ